MSPQPQPAIGSVRTIYLEQPRPTQRGNAPRPELYQWWELPSGQCVELRRIVGHHNPEAVVRNVNADGEMAPGEYVLTLRFLVTHGRKVKG
ncbi:hypothetical protein [Variovorax sp. dw_954]|uniref:hypothetical protein n=1 Tax=Variovorax sp. dw_954 TaxID=2720078 RepID=UPI001BD1E594|nr:hypothetical protein [Variovorax sp. dw_954]